MPNFFASKSVQNVGIQSDASRVQYTNIHAYLKSIKTINIKRRVAPSSLMSGPTFFLGFRILFLKIDAKHSIPLEVYEYLLFDNFF